MQEISDGKLLWLIHFDRHNYTQRWIAKAEVEAARRNLSLRPIIPATLEEIRRKPVAVEITLESDDPHPPMTWWREFLVAGAIITCDILLRRILPESVVWILSAILSVYLLHLVSAQGIPKHRRALVWSVIAILILLMFSLPDSWKN